MVRSNEIPVQANPAFVPPTVKLKTYLTISVTPLSGYVPFSVTILGQLIDELGDPVYNRAVRLLENNISVGYANTGSDGRVAITRTIGVEGLYRYVLEFAGDDQYEGCGEETEEWEGRGTFW